MGQFVTRLLGLTEVEFGSGAGHATHQLSNRLKHLKARPAKIE
jgi:hypothetical protein